MPTELAQAVTRAAYGARQLPRIAWYIGHSLVLREIADSVRQRERSPPRRRVHTNAPAPDRKHIYADMAKLFLQDLANVEAGIYPLPADHDGSLLALIRRSRMFFDDLPNIHRRRERRAHSEVLNQTTRGSRPRYYLQNFHYQSGGWLTEESAELYDTQVEILFNGSANAIRRQALPQLHEVFAGRDQRKLKIIDIGCGTGRFIDAIKQVWPKLPILGIDMSEAYLRHAKRYLRRWSRVNLSAAKGENLPVADESQDALTSIFLFHELPPSVRRAVLRECARVLKPGGRLVLVDSLQRGDRQDYDGLLELFPQSYHEPYYLSYLDEDFSALAAKQGSVHVRNVNAFISKVMIFDKRPDASANRWAHRSGQQAHARGGQRVQDARSNTNRSRAAASAARRGGQAPELN